MFSEDTSSFAAGRRVSENAFKELGDFRFKIGD
jgi:hypothetical protein